MPLSPLFLSLWLPNNPPKHVTGVEIASTYNFKLDGLIEIAQPCFIANFLSEKMEQYEIIDIDIYVTRRLVKKVYEDG